jgi:hypothetical protein
MINNAVAAPTSDFHRDDVWSVSVGLTGDLLPFLIYQPLISAKIIGQILLDYFLKCFLFKNILK